MKFCNDFHTLTDGEITLYLTEQTPGDNEILPYYYYDIYDVQGPVGKISGRIGDNAHSYYNGHLGYEIDPAHRGKRYAQRACKLVLPVARAHGMRRIHITCEETNIASRKTIEAIGAKLLEITAVPESCFFWRPAMERYCIYKLELR